MTPNKNLLCSYSMSTYWSIHFFLNVKRHEISPKFLNLFHTIKIPKKKKKKDQNKTQAYTSEILIK